MTSTSRPNWWAVAAAERLPQGERILERAQGKDSLQILASCQGTRCHTGGDHGDIKLQALAIGEFDTVPYDIQTACLHSVMPVEGEFFQGGWRTEQHFLRWPGTSQHLFG